MRKRDRIGRATFTFTSPPGLFRSFHSRISLSRPRPCDDVLAFFASNARAVKSRNVKRDTFVTNATNILYAIEITRVL